MVSLALSYARTVLRRPGTWIVLAVAGLLAMAGISLDLFAFDGGPARSMGVVVGTMEIAGALVAAGARMSGIASGESEGFRATLQQTMGPGALEVGAVFGAGIGAAIPCWAGMVILCVFYNLLTSDGVGLVRLVLLGGGLAMEATITAAWAGLGARFAGRVFAAAAATGAFVGARLGLPAAIGALLPSPLGGADAALLAGIGVGALAATGIALVTAAAPAMGEGTT